MFCCQANFTHYQMDAIMIRLILPVFAVLASSVSDAVGDDYILRIDTMGYSDSPTSAIDPQETTLCSIEVVARPHFPFYGRICVGAETIVLAGKLRPTDNGEFVVQFKYERAIDTRMTVPGEDGSQEPVIGKSLVQSIVTVAVDAGLDIGGLDMQKSSPGKQFLNSKTRHVLTLTKYAPLSD